MPIIQRLTLAEKSTIVCVSFAFVSGLVFNLSYYLWYFVGKDIIAGLCDGGMFSALLLCCIFLLYLGILWKVYQLLRSVCVMITKFL